MKTFISTNVYRIKQVVKGKACIPLLILMATLTPAVTSAEILSNIAVLTSEKNIRQSEDEDFMTQMCLSWSLSEDDIRLFFETARPLTHDYEMNIYNILDCNYSGQLEANGEIWNYNINFGGFANLSNSNESYRFGCNEGKCIEYIYYDECEHKEE